MIRYEYDIDITPGGRSAVINLKQYDSDFTLVFTLRDRKGFLTLENGTTAKIRGTKADGNGYSMPAVINIANSTVTAAGDVQMTAVSGHQPFELCLMKGDNELNTVTFYLDVHHAALDYGTVSSESKVYEVIDCLENMEDLRDEAQASADDAAASAEQAEAALTDVYKEIFNSDGFLSIYGQLRNAVFERESGNNGGFYIKFPGQFTITGIGIGLTITWADFIASIGNDYKGTSPNGVADCLYLPYKSMLLYAKSTKTFSVETYVQNSLTTDPDNVLIFSVSSGSWRDGGTNKSTISGGIGAYVYRMWSMLFDNGIDCQLDAEMYIEENPSAFYVKFDGNVIFGGTFSATVNLSAVGSTTSPKGVTNCISIANNYGLFYRTGSADVVVDTVANGDYNNYIPLLIVGRDNCYDLHPIDGLLYKNYVERANRKSDIVSDYDTDLYYEIGSISASTGGNTNSTTRLRTNEYVKVGKGSAITLNTPGTDYQYYVFKYDVNKTYTGHLEWTARTIIADSDGYMRFCIRHSDNTAFAELPENIDTFLSVYYEPCYNDILELRRDITSDIPAYWDDAINTAIDTIRSNAYTADSKLVSFFYLTDIHWKSNAQKSPKLINKIAKATGINTLLLGGDYISSYDTTKKEAVEEIDGFFSELDSRLIALPVIGNHDHNDNQQTVDAAILTDNQMYNFILQRVEKYMDTDESVINMCYDIPSKKVRFILFKQWGGSSFVDSTLAYVDAKVKELSSEWVVIVACHSYWGVSRSGGSVTFPLSTNSLRIGNAFLQTNSESEAKIIAWFVGHTHNDLETTISSGNESIRIICTTCDTYRQSAVWGSWTMTAGTDTEQAFDVVQIDRDHRKIYLTRVGAGESREYTY